MVLLIDRKKEITFCTLCNKNYDHYATRPECLIPCGHTFCHMCIRKSTSKICAKCSLHYNQIIPDYEMMDMVGQGSRDQKSLPQTKQSADSPSLLNQESEEDFEDQQSQKNQLKPEFIHLIMEGTKEQQLIGVVEVRKLLSKMSNPPIDEIIKSGLIAKLIDLLDNNDPKIQFECVWSLTNIASGNSSQTQAVVNAGAIPKFIDLLNSKSDDVQEQSVWALGNIAGDGAKSRDLVLEHGILPPLLKILNDKTKSMSFLKNSVWCLTNLFRFKPSVNFERVKEAMPILERYLVEYDSNDEILTDVLWGLSYLSDGSTSQIQLFLDNITIKNVTCKLTNPSIKVVTPTLRIIGNIASGSDVQTQVILDLDVLKDLKNCLEINKCNIQKEICWTISNITAGTQSQIQQVIECGIMPKIIELAKNASFNVKKEALWVIANAFSGGTKDQMLYMVNLGVLEIIDKHLIKIEDVSVQNLCLSVFESVGEALQNVLKVTIMDLELPNTLSLLENSTNSDVSNKASRLIDKFLSRRSSGSYEEEASDNELDDNKDVIS